MIQMKMINWEFILDKKYVVEYKKNTALDKMIGILNLSVFIF